MLPSQENPTCEPEDSGSSGRVSGSAGGLLVTTQTSTPMRVFIQANPNSPAEPLHEHLLHSLDAAPNANDVVYACSYWRHIIGIMRGRQWGEFVYEFLAIPDGEQFRQCLKDFESVLFVLDKIVSLAGEIHDAAFEADPSGLAGKYLEAKWLARDVGLASLHLQEVVSLRRDGLDALQEFARERVLEFQNI